MSFESPIAPEAALPTPREFRAQRASFVFLAYVGIQFFAGFFIGIAAAIWYLATHRHGAPSVPEAILRSATMWGATIGMVASGATAYWLTRQLVGRAPQGHPLEPFGWSNSTLRPMLIAALAGVILGGLYMLATLGIPVPDNVRPGLMGRAILGGGWTLFMWVILALVIAPPVEEFVFRGMLWTGLRRSWGPLLSGVVVTALFVALHLPEAWGYAPAIVAIGAMGVLALAMRISSRSLIPPILVHTGYNAVIVAATLASYA